MGTTFDQKVTARTTLCGPVSGLSSKEADMVTGGNRDTRAPHGGKNGWKAATTATTTTNMCALLAKIRRTKAREEPQIGGFCYGYSHM